MDLSDPNDRLRARQLLRTKMLATGLLVACLGVLIVARSLAGQHPLFGYLAAFAEAAAIGGIADWYAVVALFRRPLGLPIPHTAIVPHSQARIGDSLGDFIARQFLADAPIEARLKEVDFAALIAGWLSERSNSDDLARFGLRLLPQALSALDSSGLRRFLASRAADQLGRLQLAPFAAGILGNLTRDRRHQRILDELLEVLARLLQNPAALESIRERIRVELPSLFNLFRADAYLLRRLVASTGAFIEEVRRQPEHAVRAEFDGFVQGFLTQLEASPDFAARLEELKHEILQRPELADLAEAIWQSVQEFVVRQAGEPQGLLRRPLRNLLQQVGRHLSEDAALRADVNRGMVLLLQTFVASQRPAIAAFVADQVKAWDSARLIATIELNVGRDLQFIRFNGTLIGGCVGLILYCGQKLLALQ